MMVVPPTNAVAHCPDAAFGQTAGAPAQANAAGSGPSFTVAVLKDVVEPVRWNVLPSVAEAQLHQVNAIVADHSAVDRDGAASPSGVQDGFLGIDHRLPN